MHIKLWGSHCGYVIPTLGWGTWEVTYSLLAGQSVRLNQEIQILKA